MVISDLRSVGKNTPLSFVRSGPGYRCALPVSLQVVFVL